jgi:hypothetical protein
VNSQPSAVRIKCCTLSRQLVRRGQLLRLGYGVYGRAVRSRLFGEPILYSENGFLGAARQALTKLGVAWEPADRGRARL